MLCFFFQAEDGIRDVAVTGVQTCALPIFTVAPGGGVGALAPGPLPHASRTEASATPPEIPIAMRRPRSRTERRGYPRGKTKSGWRPTPLGATGGVFMTTAARWGEGANSHRGGEKSV